MSAPSYELVAVARTPNEAFGPFLTEVGPIIAPTITWTNELNRPGGIAFSCTADRLADDIKARLLHLDTNPTEVWLYRNGVKVAAAFIAGYQIQNGTLSVTAPGLLGYLAYWAVDSDQTFTNIDQFTIATWLVDQWQDLEWGSVGIDTGDVGSSGVSLTRTYIAAEQHFVDERIRELGQASDGFDIAIDPVTRELDLYHPRRGTDLSATVILDARNITDPGVVVSVAPGVLASEAYGTGGDGERVFSTLISNTALRAAYGRTAVMESFDGIVSQTGLNRHTQALLDVRDQALFLPGPGLLPVEGAGVEDFDVGDTVTYEFDSGLGLQSGAFRVATREVSINEDGVEDMAVTFA